MAQKISQPTCINTNHRSNNNFKFPWKLSEECQQQTIYILQQILNGDVRLSIVRDSIAIVHSRKFPFHSLEHRGSTRGKTRIDSKANVLQNIPKQFAPVCVHYVDDTFSLQKQRLTAKPSDCIDADIRVPRIQGMPLHVS